MGVTSGEEGQSGEQGTSRASAEPIELSAIKNREKVLREQAEKEADLLRAQSPRAKQHSPTPSIRISTAHAAHGTGGSPIRGACEERIFTTSKRKKMPAGSATRRAEGPGRNASAAQKRN